MTREWSISGPFGSLGTGPPCHHPGSDPTLAEDLGRRPAKCLSTSRVQNQKRGMHQWPHRCRRQGRTPSGIYDCAAGFAPWLYPLDGSSAQPRHVNGDDYPLNMCKLCQGTLQKSKNSTEPDSRRAAPTSMCAAVNRIGTCHVITLSLGLKYQ